MILVHTLGWYTKIIAKFQKFEMHADQIKKNVLLYDYTFGKQYLCLIILDSNTLYHNNIIFFIKVFIKINLCFNMHSAIVSSSFSVNLLLLIIFK